MKFLAALTISCLVPILAFSQTDAPAAPTGFHWKTVEEVKFQFLHPDGWFFKSEINGNTFAFFSTKEEITPTSDFQTGLTVNVITKVKQDTDAYIEKFFKTYQSQNSLSYFDRVQFGPFRGIKYGTTKKFDDGSESTIANFIISNKSRGTIFMIIFEAPVSLWDKEWEIGKVIMANLGIDDGI